MLTAREKQVSVAVLPLVDLSSAENLSHLARGFTEDLLAGLVRFPAIDVHHGNAVMDTASEALDLGRARDLGVAYAVRGSLRRDASTLRVSAQLLETGDGRLTWAETFDAPLEDLFEVQDEIVARVAGALAVHLDDRRLAGARRLPLGGLSTYECWLSGLDCLRQGTLEADDEAREYFERAIELDPDYARAWAGLSLTYFNEWSCQVWHLFEENESGAFDNARRAAELDDSDGVVQLVLGRVLVFRRDFEAGKRALDRSLRLCPNDPEVLAHQAILRSSLGEPELALELARKAQRLNPRHPPWYPVGEAIALYLLRRFDEALAAASRAANAFVHAPVLRAAAAAMLGDETTARSQREEFVRQFRLKITFGREPDTEEMLRWLAHVNPMRRDEDAALLLEGIVRSGFDTGGLGLADLQAAAGVLPARPRPCSPELPLSGNVFRRRGDSWTVAFGGHGAELGEVKGFFDLARLLDQPEVEVHCLELRGSPPLEDAGAATLDDRARREIEARVDELRAEIEEADGYNDLGRAERARSELERLHAELSRAFGLGGRPRRIGDPAEKARTAVTWRIRSAIKKLEVAHPRLGRHLGVSIKTGTFCVYAPETPVQWQIRVDA